MKDYMMWLDDQGVATWDRVLGELIVPDEVDIYDDVLVDRYKNDAVWNGLDVPGIDTDEDDYVIDDDDDDRDYELDDDELGDISLSGIQRDILKNILENITEAGSIPDDLGTDEIVQKWYLLESIKNTNTEDPQLTVEDHMDTIGDEGRQLSFWMGSDGLTGDAENYLHNEYLTGELV